MLNSQQALASNNHCRTFKSLQDIVESLLLNRFNQNAYTSILAYICREKNKLICTLLKQLFSLEFVKNSVSSVAICDAIELNTF